MLRSYVKELTKKRNEQSTPSSSSYYSASYSSIMSSHKGEDGQIKTQGQVRAYENNNGQKRSQSWELGPGGQWKTLEPQTRALDNDRAIYLS